MGNLIKRIKSNITGVSQQGIVYSAPPGHQMVQHQPIVPNTVPMRPTQPSTMHFQQQMPVGYHSTGQPGLNMPHYDRQPSSSASYPNKTYRSIYEDNVLLSNLTGWQIPDIERLRNEFFSYTNPHGVIDREGFRKLYLASLLNMTWDTIERESEATFRRFDINQTGTLEFNEYVMACLRMSKDLHTLNRY